MWATSGPQGVKCGQPTVSRKWHILTLPWADWVLGTLVAHRQCMVAFPLQIYKFLKNLHGFPVISLSNFKSNTKN